ncbi:hypothetical protein D3C71_1652340 [compost metagenome]
MQEAQHGPGGRGHRREGRLAVAAEGELGLQVRIGALPLAATEGVAGLGHELIDHPVPDLTVIEAAPRQQPDALDMTGRQFGSQLDQDAALAGVDHQQVLRRNRAPRAFDHGGSRRCRRRLLRPGRAGQNQDGRRRQTR